jgi:drug/metabolite transporter (DMT)-like permease
MLLVLLINALMGATFSIVKLILDHYTDPFFLVGYRMMLAGFLLLGYLLIFNKSALKINRADWFTFVQIVLFHVYVCYNCEFWGQKYLSPAKVALLFNLTPFITAGLSYLLYRQKQSMQKILGLIIGFVGIFPVLFAYDPVENILGNLFLISLPEFILLISVFSAAYGWLIVEHLVIKRNYSILMVNGYAMFIGGFLSIITSYILGNYGQLFGAADLARAWNPWPFNDFIQLTFWILLLIILSNLIYYNAYGFLMRKYSLTFLSLCGLTIPLFAVLWEWLFFGNLVELPFWISLLVTSFGLGIYYYEEINHKREK